MTLFVVGRISITDVGDAGKEVEEGDASEAWVSFFIIVVESVDASEPDASGKTITVLGLPGGVDAGDT